jgi:chromosome segregation ATPase
MTTVTENDLRELKDLINSRFDQLEKGQIEIKADVKALSEKVDNMDKRLAIVEASLEDWKPSIAKTADLAEKVGELKNWRSIAFLILGAIAGWIARNSTGNP